ncbi:MAG: hypothetical protein IT547_03905 [Hyphomonadaceae bacterium]|nr:hypothetical protein [Hyphomonadaceae bacterium]
MSSSTEIRSALELVWERMGVLVEEGNDLVVNEQRQANATAARHIAEIASDLGTLSRAAEVLAKLGQHS